MNKSPIQTHYSSGEITELNKVAEEAASAALSDIVKIPPCEQTFENTFTAFDRIMTDYSDMVRPLVLMGSVYPDEKIASEGMSCEESFSVFDTCVFTRRDLYEILKRQIPKNPGESRLYDVTIRKFEKNGLKFSEDKLIKVREMKKELAGLETSFSANLNNDSTTLELTSDELFGVPDSSVATFSKTPAGTYLITMKYPDYLAVMTYAQNGETRRKMYTAYNSRQADTNTPLLEKAIVLRENIAKELGYSDWACYKIEGRMAENTENVMKFLSSLKEPLKEKYASEMAELLLIKKSFEPGAEAVELWDIAYLSEIQKKQKYSYDEEKVREYFPLDTVLSGLFKLYENLFGVKFEEIGDAPVWYPDVRLIGLKNTAGEITGYLYLDLFPRAGKYSHFCASEAISGRLKDGKYMSPVMAIIGNFHKPEGKRPSLLTVDEIETLFHETGHAVHYLLTTAPYGTLSGYDVEWDFVETPSQTLEEWTWDSDVLTSISGHYTGSANTGSVNNSSVNYSSEKIPPEILDCIIAARNVGKGNLYSRLLINSLEDMCFHTRASPVDVNEIYSLICEEITGRRPPAKTSQPASFGHLMGGYDAGYYGYLWAKVYALNIVDEFRKEGMTNQNLGLKFRNEILSKGNMEEGMVLLKNFLGREPGVEALYRYLGIEV